MVCDVRRASDGEAYALVVYDIDMNIDSNLQDLYESVFQFLMPVCLGGEMFGHLRVMGEFEHMT